MEVIKQFTLQCTKEQRKDNPNFLIETMLAEDVRYLEYLFIVADNFNPDIASEWIQQSDNPEDVIERIYLVPSNAPYIFKRRYNSNKLQHPFTVTDYLKNDKIKTMLSLFNLDVEKFWYLLLYIYDNSYDLCQRGIDLDVHPNVDKIVKLLEEQDQKVLVTIGEGKNAITVKDTVSNLSEFINWLKLETHFINSCLNTNFKMTEKYVQELENPRISSKWKEVVLAKTIWSYDFTRKLLFFLNNKGIDNKESFKIIALILNFTELQVTYKSDNIKLLLHKYKDYKFPSIHCWY